MPIKSISLLLLGACVGVIGFQLAQPSSAEPLPALAKEDPQYRSLDANLYVQASAEYRACCLQAYNLAKLRLVEKLAQRKDGAKSPAVVLDLDETVFDNSGYQTMIARGGLGFDLKLFHLWEEKYADLVEPVPGALEFLAFAKEKNVALCYISNRQNVEQCHVVLKRMNIDVPAAQLKLIAKDGSSEKDTRRGEIKKDFDVLLYVGDNLRDFDDIFRYEKDIEKLTIPDARTRIPLRNKVVDDNAAKFGNEYIIIPNPMYGEWPKPFGRGAADLEFLRPVKK